MRTLPVEKWTMSVTVTDADGTRTVTLTGMEIIYARSAMAEAWNASNRIFSLGDPCSLRKIVENLRDFRDHHAALQRALGMEESCASASAPAPARRSGGCRITGPTGTIYTRNACRSECPKYGIGRVCDPQPGDPCEGQVPAPSSPEGA